MPSIDYLGVILEGGVTCMDPIKVAGIRDWPTPQTVKDIRSFLGFCNFYRPFIKGFSTIARPLNELTCKDVEWKWENPQRQAFETLKRRVTSEPILTHDGRFYNELSLNKFIFHRLLTTLKTTTGLRGTWHVSAAEQLAIFLHYVRRGLPNRALQERFQRSRDTIMK